MKKVLFLLVVAAGFVACEPDELEVTHPDPRPYIVGTTTGVEYYRVINGWDTTENTVPVTVKISYGTTGTFPIHIEVEGPSDTAYLSVYADYERDRNRFYRYEEWYQWHMYDQDEVMMTADGGDIIISYNGAFTNHIMGKPSWAYRFIRAPKP